MEKIDIRIGKTVSESHPVRSHLRIVEQGARGVFADKHGERKSKGFGRELPIDSQGATDARGCFTTGRRQAEPLSRPPAEVEDSAYGGLAWLLPKALLPNDREASPLSPD